MYIALALRISGTHSGSNVKKLNNSERRKKNKGPSDQSNATYSPDIKLCPNEKQKKMVRLSFENDYKKGIAMEEGFTQ